MAAAASPIACLTRKTNASSDRVFFRKAGGLLWQYSFKRRFENRAVATFPWPYYKHQSLARVIVCLQSRCQHHRKRESRHCLGITILHTHWLKLKNFTRLVGFARRDSPTRGQAAGLDWATERANSHHHLGLARLPNTFPSKGACSPGEQQTDEETAHLSSGWC